MKLIDFKNKLAGTLFAMALLFGIGLAANTTANAQYPQYPYPNDRTYRRDRDRDRDRDYRRDNDDYRRDNDWRNRRYGRSNDGYPDLGGSFNLRQTALNAGYNNGIKAGREDRNRGRGYSYQDDREFQRATKDYNSRLGDLGLYRTYFRQAFVNGYADGYRGY